MKYRQTITLKDGRSCVLRNGAAQDGPAAWALFIRTHSQTDFLLTYPEENSFTPDQEAQFLTEKDRVRTNNE